MATTNFGNTGVRDTNIVFQTPRRIFLLRTTADDGTSNVIDLTAPGTKVDQAFLDARLNELDASKRWLDVGKIENVAITKADNVTFETGGGTVFQIRDGVQTVAFSLMKQDVKLLKAFVQVKCGSASDFSFFIVDDCKNILVEELTPNILSPLKMAQGTFSDDYVFANETDPNMIMFTWNIDQVVDLDNNGDTISGDDVVTANILSPQSLFNTNVVNIANITTTGFDFDLEFDFGGAGAGNKEITTGVVTADVSLDEISPTPGNIPVTIVENSPGKYSAAYALQISGDVLELSSLQPLLDKKVELVAFRVTIP